jgi:hypothetical protein
MGLNFSNQISSSMAERAIPGKSGGRAAGKLAIRGAIGHIRAVWLR